MHRERSILILTSFYYFWDISQAWWITIIKMKCLCKARNKDSKNRRRSKGLHSLIERGCQTVCDFRSQYFNNLYRTPTKYTPDMVQMMDLSFKNVEKKAWVLITYHKENKTSNTLTDFSLFLVNSIFGKATYYGTRHFRNSGNVAQCQKLSSTWSLPRTAFDQWKAVYHLWARRLQMFLVLPFYVMTFCLSFGHNTRCGLTLDQPVTTSTAASVLQLWQRRKLLLHPSCCVWTRTGFAHATSSAVLRFIFNLAAIF